jgi:GT2 family glycosyltransferase
MNKALAVLVIPFYKNEAFIENIGQYFSLNADERELFSEILVINDCPDSPQSSYLETTSNRYGFNYLANTQNVGFLLSANIGIERAIKQNAHVVILNSDTIPTGGCFSELLSVFEFDSMVGCVCPRSNNATIANLWPQSIFANNKSDVDELAQVAQTISTKMPKISYTPVINGFCFAIRNSVILNFGGFDEDFIPGYEEENEYCLRISESGYKVAIANHSFIGHLEGRSFSLKPGRSELMQDHYQKIIGKYQYYSDRVAGYFSSIEKKAIDILSAGTWPQDSMGILVDGRVLHCHHNGTMKVIRDVVVELSKIGYKVDLIANRAAAKFHNIENIEGVSLVDGPRSYYDIGIKIGQPFEYHSLLTVPLFSKCSVNIFFDTIGIDCINLYDQKINDYWRSLDDLYSLVFFISDHSKEQFMKRYHPVSTECIPLLLPTRIEKKTKKYQPIISQKYIFVVGNKFKHKGLDIALTQLPKKIGIKYVLLSVELKTERDDLIFLKPGLLTDEEIASLYQNCEEIIFPSFSEGFGYPLLEALQYGKRITCRPLDSLLEIYESIPIEYQKLVNFVNDFSGNNTEITTIKKVKLSSHDEAEYVSKILEYAVLKIRKISYVDILRRLNLADHYLFNFSYIKTDNSSSGDIENSLARSIYMKLLRYRTIRPLMERLKNLYRSYT